MPAPADPLRRFPSGQALEAGHAGAPPAGTRDPDLLP